MAHGATPGQEHCKYSVLQGNMCWSPCWSQGHHRTFTSLTSSVELTQERLRRSLSLPRLVQSSLLWIFFFSAWNSFMFLAPDFIAISRAALPPTTESQTCPAHRSPPQLCYSTPILPTQSPSIFSPAGHCESVGCFGQAAWPKQLKGRGGDMTTGWAHCRTPQAPFQVCLGQSPPPPSARLAPREAMHVMVEEGFTQQFLVFLSLGSTLKSELEGNSHRYISGWFFIPTSPTPFEKAALCIRIWARKETSPQGFSGPQCPAHRCPWDLPYGCHPR